VKDTKGSSGGKATATSVLRIDARSPPRKALIMKPTRLLFATALAAGTVLLPAAAASAATPAPGPTFGTHVSDCARTMGFSGAHNPAMMREGMSGMDMDLTTSTST